MEKTSECGEITDDCRDPVIDDHTTTMARFETFPPVHRPDLTTFLPFLFLQQRRQSRHV